MPPAIPATNNEVTLTTPSKPPEVGCSPEAEPLIPETSSPNSSFQGLKPLKTYTLSVPPESALYRVNFRPSATKISVVSRSGDTIVRCGDSVKTYRCQPGNPLNISYGSGIEIKNGCKIPAKLMW
ncbi:MAG: hypothetical protein F6J93_24340 [Oscillatoria sp. SIO1A7]|nr:hypothetical protein [Oscillatoria sp. SIO1A7]